MKIGDELPVMEIRVTTTLVVGGAIASRDFQDVHHDAAAARAAGAKDVFLNILTTNGLVARYVTDWMPDATLKGIGIRLGVPCYPGDTLTLTGSVASQFGATVVVEVRGSNAAGDHVTGTVTLEVPR